MSKIYSLLFSILFANAIVYGHDYNDDKKLNDSIDNKPINIKDRAANKFSYLQTSQQLSNTLYYSPEDAINFSSTLDSINTVFTTIVTSDRWINSVTNNITMPVPFGIKRVIGVTNYELAFTNIVFTREGAIARVFARVVPNEGMNGVLSFAGNINLSRIGGAGSNNILTQIATQTINYHGGNIQLSIKGGTTNASQFIFDCNGFTSLNLQCDVALASSTYFPVNTSYQRISNTSIVSNKFNIELTSWEDLFKGVATFNNQTFGNANIPDYFFNIQQAILDLSTIRNPTEARSEVSTYITANSGGLPTTWQGIVIERMEVILPAYFNAGATRSRVPADYGIIDGNGLTFRVSNQENILTLSSTKAGSANGWPLAIDAFNIHFEKNILKTATSYFTGKVVLPIEDRNYANRGVPFTVQILQDERNKKFVLEASANEIDFITAKNFRGYLLTSSDDIELEFTIKNNLLFPKVTFSGTFGLISNRKSEEYSATEMEKQARGNTLGSDKEVAMKEIEFQDLVLQTETAPFMKISHLGGGVEVEIGNHAAQITVEFRNTGVNARGRTNPNAACLHFDAAIQLAEGKFQGGVGIDLYCIYNADTKTFEFEELRLGSINIKADIGPAASIDGAIDILNSPEYGLGFSGQVILTVSKSLTVQVGVMFGSQRKTGGGKFNYFNFDGSANFKPKGVIIFGCVKVTGFSGGFTYKMDPIPASSAYPPTITGVSYKPNENSFLRFRAGIYFALADEKVFSGWGGLEFVFNQNWGLNEVNISGSAQLFSQPINDDKVKISPLMQARQQSYMTYKADAGEIADDRGEEINKAGERVFVKKKSSVNYLTPPASTVVKTSTEAEDTVSVAQQIAIVKPLLDAAIADSIRLKTMLDTAIAQQTRADSIKAAMQRRSNSIDNINPQNREIATQFSFFAGTDVTRVNNFYHNSYRNKHRNEWIQICTLLNIPFIQDNILQTRRATYTVPTQTRINFVKDSLSKNLKPSQEATATLILRDTFQRRADRFETLRKSGTRHTGNPNTRQLNDLVFTKQWGYLLASTQPTDLTKKFNDSVKLYWRRLDSSIIDSARIYKRLLDSTNAIIQQGNIANNPILQILNDKILFPNIGWQSNFSVTTNRGNINGINTNGTKFTLLNEATINYNYYVNILVPRFRIEDSIANYSQNIVKPIYDSVFKRRDALNQIIAKKRPLERTYFDTLLVINNYNNLVASTQNIRIRQLARNTTLTAAENAKIAEANAALTRVTPIINAFVTQNKIKQQAQLSTNKTNIANAIATQRNIINSTTATASQKTAAQANLNNLLIQYRIDSTAAANNILAANGGPIFTYPGKLEMYHISKYVPTSFRNTDVLYTTISRLETNLVEINRTGLFRALTTEEQRRKQRIEDSLNNERRRAVYVIAFSLLNTPEKASADLFNYRSIAINFEPVAKSIDTAQAWLDRAIAFIEDSIVSASTDFGSTKDAVMRSLTRNIRPADNPKFWGNFLLKIDVKNSRVKLEMDVYASIDQQLEDEAVEVIKGDMNDYKLAGTLDFDISKDGFSLKIGEKSAPCKVEASFGSFLTGKGTFYLQCSNRQTVTPNYATNFNISFGISGQLNQGGSVDLGLGELYAYLSSGFSFDASVARYQNLICVGESSNGFNGWYGTASFTAFLKGKVGVRNKLGDITLIGGSAKVSVTVAGPTPLYYSGRVDVTINVLGISGDFSITLDYGKLCQMH